MKRFLKGNRPEIRKLNFLKVFSVQRRRLPLIIERGPAKLHREICLKDKLKHTQNTAISVQQIALHKGSALRGLGAPNLGRKMPTRQNGVSVQNRVSVNRGVDKCVQHTGCYAPTPSRAAAKRLAVEVASGPARSAAV